MPQLTLVMGWVRELVSPTSCSPNFCHSRQHNIVAPFEPNPCFIPLYPLALGRGSRPPWLPSGGQGCRPLGAAGGSRRTPSCNPPHPPPSSPLPRWPTPALRTSSCGPRGGGGNNCSSLTLYSLSAAVSLLSGLHVGGPHADDTHCLSFNTKRRPSNNILPLSLRCFQLQCSGAVRRSDWLQRWTHAAAAALPRPVRALQGGPACEPVSWCSRGAAHRLHRAAAAAPLRHLAALQLSCTPHVSASCSSTKTSVLLCPERCHGARGELLPTLNPHRACSTTSSAPLHLPNYKPGLALEEFPAMNTVAMQSQGVCC